MPDQMTKQQMKIFVGASQMGIACGLNHPWEWLANAERALSIGPWHELNQRQHDLYDAFLAWWHGCGAGPGDPCETATVEQMVDEVNRWYADQRKRHESTRPSAPQSPADNAGSDH